MLKLSNPNFVLLTQPPCNPCDFGKIRVDFTEITDAEGDYLISIGSPYVKRKEATETIAPVAIAAKATLKEPKTD